jgi:hypothetical protein
MTQDMIWRILLNWLNHADVAEDDDNEDVISDGNRNQGGSGSYASKFVSQLQRQI